MNNKIGVGLITCNKPDRFRQSAPLIPNVDEFVVVNDGQSYTSEDYAAVKGRAEIIQHDKNMCVGVSKNDAMRYLVQKDCSHIFLIEDDVLIKDPNVFEAYIHAAENSGIWHLNYALQGPANRKQNTQSAMNINQRQDLSQTSDPNPRAILDYDGIDIALYPNSVGAFSYFLKSVIKTVGYHDEHFKNAFEHVELTYRIAQAGLHPPFWWFADLGNSYDYLTDIPDCIANSTIAHTPEWIQNFQKAMAWNKVKHGFVPQQTPDTKPEEVLKVLDNMKKNYARKVYKV